MAASTRIASTPSRNRINKAETKLMEKLSESPPSCLAAFCQLALGQLQLLRHLGFREAIAQRPAVGHQLLLGGAAQIGVDVVQRAFHQLEALQVGRHRQVVGLVAVAFAIDREALVQGGGGMVDQLPRTALLQRRMRTQARKLSAAASPSCSATSAGVCVARVASG